MEWEDAVAGRLPNRALCIDSRLRYHNLRYTTGSFDLVPLAEFRKDGTCALSLHFGL